MRSQAPRSAQRTAPRNRQTAPRISLGDTRELPAIMAEAEMTDAPPKELASNLTLDILQIVKVSQSQHGLRHGDHMRYRQYCTRRLARIYKALKFSHGRGRYQKRTLEPELVASADHLLIPLVSICTRLMIVLEITTSVFNHRQTLLPLPPLRFQLRMVTPTKF